MPDLSSVLARVDKVVSSRLSADLRSAVACSPAGLTRLELDALLALLAVILNDPDFLESAGLSRTESAAVHRAEAKLRASQLA
jgi:hypothetical protein